MKKLFVFSMAGRIYGIYGTPNGFETTVSKVSVYGQELKEFGTTWAGAKLDADDFFQTTLSSYINGDEGLKFTFTHSSFRELKRKEQTFVVIGGKKVPKFCFLKEGEKTFLVAVTKNDFKYYAGNNGMVCVNPGNEIITTIDAFAMGSLADDVEKDNIFWASEKGGQLIAELKEE